MKILRYCSIVFLLISLDLASRNDLTRLKRQKRHALANSYTNKYIARKNAKYPMIHFNVNTQKPAIVYNHIFREKRRKNLNTIYNNFVKRKNYIKKLKLRKNIQYNSRGSSRVLRNKRKHNLNLFNDVPSRG